ncbi:hypothetical protein NE237_001594 [Protea cynaroides]|uniref:Uncharacterized protein n=1 Tax=Protea cynaroides TaxID=273540 RepID=A0A9Q0KTE4_9MAGN|nr:hypothetical protein NE237_001594 [Protea cynaroides]
MLQLFFVVAFSVVPLTLYIPPVQSFNLFVETIESFLQQSTMNLFSGDISPVARATLVRCNLETLDLSSNNFSHLISSEFLFPCDNLISLNLSRGDDGLSDLEPQDADYFYVSSLNDELALLILLRISISEHRKFCGDLYKIRRPNGIREASIFMLACGEPHWWAFDWQFTTCRKLPILPSDECFASGHKKSLCARTHLLVFGKEFEGMAI